MTTTEFTQLEEQVLRALIYGLDAEPGFSNIDANDLAEMTGIDTKQIRGVLSSLVKKGVVTLDKTDNWQGPQYVLIYLNESHWHLHPEWKNEVN